MNITVFLGAPGSGKGTQAKRLAESKKFIHLSTGDRLREAMQKGDDLGKRAKIFVDRGELVPDSIMIDLIDDCLTKFPLQARVLLDGFPRTLAQAKALDNNPATRVERAINFVVPEEALVARLTGRRICEKCGEPFHVEFVPPRKDNVCDKCGGKLYQRADDKREVVTKRLEVYRNLTEPLLSYYQSGNKLAELNGNKPAEVIQQDLTRLLNGKY